MGGNIRRATLEELLKQEDAFLEREEKESDSNGWINEGVRIYRGLSQHKPNEIRYQVTLAYFLLRKGEDLKMREHNYEKALRVFQKVVNIDPTNAIAYYRLGFLHFYLEAWAKSIDCFQTALNVMPQNARYQLTQEQKIKAHHYILKASEVITRQTLRGAETFSEEDLTIFPEIKLVIEELSSGIRPGEVEKPYLMYLNGTTIQELSEREYDELTDPYENSLVFVFNQRSVNDAYVSFLEKEVPIPPRRVALLEMLMRHPQGVSRDVIIERLYADSGNPRNTLNQHIGRLRERLRELVGSRDVIQTVSGGFRWNWNEEYQIFKHSRDVSSDLLPD